MTKFNFEVLTIAAASSITRPPMPLCRQDMLMMTGDGTWRANEGWENTEESLPARGTLGTILSRSGPADGVNSLDLKQRLEKPRPD